MAPTALIIYWALGAIKNIYFHPLKSIPGPLLPRASNLYYYYYSIFQDGALSQRLPSLHQYYDSPVIRIAPNHVHINDVDIYRQQVPSHTIYSNTNVSRVYCNKTKFLKWDFFYQSSEKVDSIVTVTDPHRHQIYRSRLGPLFSMRSIDQSSSLIIGQFIKAGDSMIRLSENEEMVDTGAIFKALALGMTEELVDYDNAEKDLLLTSLDTVTTRIQLCPYTVPGLVQLKQKCIESISRSVEARNTGKNAKPSLFDSLLDLYPEEAVDPEKNSNRLYDHAMAMIFAGIESVGYTFSAAIFYLLRSPDVLGKLREELEGCDVKLKRETFVEDFGWHVLLQLPYLTAVIKETLRTFPVAPGPLPRVVPSEGLSVGSHVLPGGTIISATINGFHKNPSIFPNPDQFDPSRWLDKNDMMEKALTPFSRGTRGCIGRTLAMRELYTGIAYLVSRCDMELSGEYPDTMEFSDHGVAKPLKPVIVRIYLAVKILPNSIDQIYPVCRISLPVLSESTGNAHI
ncbi:hypothetical protein ASPWEDRAFT_28167 [Aspergillus wentii DTO 134E9]|uniref:Cytochrome P450 n=1 Tax=Aspergillus wentii DTO 134E9 TaxID=1073089 RepID=A0A1L9RKT8_ASPWE|nr:uncharacterized protein ASPWEDRAFT_28167 [Aspergillus wentii DTO 134E9]OJJ35540.1 hypothetical protein ASPWEDRAFT_28167 [Aspergillus wentii DTO 134E9]